MPVFNEEATVATAIQQVLDTDLPVRSFELLVMDDGSTDGTPAVIAEDDWPPHVRVVSHERNHGKGAAIRTGLQYARGAYCAIMDADLEYDPADIAKLLSQLQSERFEVAFGTRGFLSHSSYSFWYVVGNRAVTLAANILYNSWISDVMTCQKVMRTDLFRSLNLRENGFGIEPEITARLLRAGIQIYEVPITYRARTRLEGKKLTWLDGLRVLRTLLRCRVT